MVGALHRQVGPDGVTFERLPAWTRTQVVDPALQLVVRMPAGVRLAFRSASRVLELDLAALALRFGDRPVRPPVLDVVVDGALTGTIAVGEHATYHLRGPRVEDAVLLPGGPTTVRLELPGPGHLVEVWLPHDAVIEVQGARIDQGTSLDPSPAVGRRWVHHGSSISHCLEAEQPTATWPALVARRAGVDLLDLAFAGQCLLDPWTARTIRDEPADLISLKLGINVVNGDAMRERTFHAALHGFLDTVRDGHPATPLLVVTPIVCPAAEEHPGPTLPGPDGRFGVVARPVELSSGALSLRRVREVVTEVVRSRQATDPALHLLDGLALFGPDDGAQLPDGLHPDAQGYRVIAERFYAAAFTGRGPFTG